MHCMEDMVFFRNIQCTFLATLNVSDETGSRLTFRGKAMARSA